VFKSLKYWLIVGNLSVEQSSIFTSTGVAQLYRIRTPAENIFI